jgi:hypothetical protein
MEATIAHAQYKSEMLAKQLRKVQLGGYRDGSKKENKVCLVDIPIS